ncbi:MAG TPA: homoserine kinase, partial [Polyangiaceae bacterium]|nr:homoserine kinase [Polyangiaceae bacterium]
MALLTPMTLAEARAIGSEYGLDIASVEALRAGSVNSNFRLRTVRGEDYFLRVYEEQDGQGAGRELEMIAALARLGVPTPPPRERVQKASAGSPGLGRHAARHAGKPVGVHAWVAGESVCLRQVTTARVRQLGRALARVHACSPAVSRLPEGRFEIRDLLRRLEHVERVDARFAADTRLIRDRIAQHASAASDLPRGLIHGDLFRDNVLWQGDELVALLDFESASSGYFIYDLMVCAHAWCYGEAYDLSLVGALFQGYEEVRRLESAEWDALLPQGCLGALRFATTR